MSPTIICVDDDKYLLATLAEQIHSWVGSNYTVERALSGQEALEVLEDCLKNSEPVPLVISDYIMPGMNGAELLTKVHAMDKSIKKIMLTGYLAAEGIVTAINNASLYRFVSKPWNNKDLMLTVLEALRSYDTERKNQVLLQSFERLYRGYETQIEYLLVTTAGAIETKCGQIGSTKIVARLSGCIAQKAGLSADDVKAMRVMSCLRNIGRLGMDEADLCVIRKNETRIYDYPDVIEKQNKAAESIFNTNPLFDSNNLKGIAYQFEKYNGSGVRGMEGTNIPIESRIIGLAGFYASLVSGGGEHVPMRPPDAISTISSLKGTFFDPVLTGILAEAELWLKGGRGGTLPDNLR